MANRSCLYACDRLPTRDSEEPVNFTGIGEHKWDVPFIHKLMLSGDPRACKSAVWNWDEDIAIAGDFAAGVTALMEFLTQVDNEKTHELVEETRAYIKGLDPDTTYLVAEVGEILEMDDTEYPEQIASLIKDIKGLRASSDYDNAIRLASGFPQERSGIMGLLFGPKKAADPIQELYNLGLGYWSDVLYFDPNERNTEPKALTEGEIPESVARLIAEFKTAFESGAVEDLENLVCWEGIPETERDSTRRHCLSTSSAGAGKITSLSVFPVEEEMYEDYICSLTPEWKVDYEFECPGSTTGTSFILGTRDGQRRIVSMMRTPT